MKPIKKAKIERIDKILKRLKKTIRNDWIVRKWKIDDVRSKSKKELKKLLNMQANKIRWYRNKIFELRIELISLLKENKDLLNKNG